MPISRMATAIAAFSLAVAAPAIPTLADDTSDMVVAQASSFSEQKLEAFAEAALEVQEIQSRYMQQVQSAGSETQQQEIIAEANQEMVSAVESTPGIEVAEYNAIIDAANSDPELAQQVNAYLEQAE